MLTKFGKIKDPQLLSDYRYQNTRCEHCKDSPWQLELHHICGGVYRTDELWNIIMLCNLCHQKATYHNLQYGADAKAFNVGLVFIKIGKDEFDIDRATQAWVDLPQLLEVL